jgi:hypothetical protein
MRMEFKQGADVFVLAPTGMGKVRNNLALRIFLTYHALFQSLCFQVPAIADKVSGIVFLCRWNDPIFELCSMESLL